ASRAAACWSRARWSGCQPLSAAGSAGRQDATATGRLHPGAKAVFLGAVALLRLKGLFGHRDCPGSSPSGLGDGLSLPPEGTQTRLAPESARRVVVRRMIGRVREGCQTWPGSVYSLARDRAGKRPTLTAAAGPHRARTPDRPRTDTPVEYRKIALRLPSGRCYPLRALGAGDVQGIPPGVPTGSSGSHRPVPKQTACPSARDPRPRSATVENATHQPSPHTAGSHRRMDAKQVWRAALGELQVSLSPANFETWLRDTQLVDVDEQRFRIAVPNGFAKDWLESRYRSLISQTLARIVGYSVQVEFVIASSGEAQTEMDGTMTAGSATTGSSAPTPAERQQVRLEPTRVGGEGGTTFINPRYTFSNFIVGSANRLAHAASLSVAERPGHAYNPLFLYGGVGLGKTHLMHAIGNQVIAKFPRKRVVYATSEKFTNEFIASIQQGKIDEFRARYRRIDLLLIDDIQFIADKERTQEEFFHTFNAIHEDGKQIVLSSDRPPKAILTLEER